MSSQLHLDAHDKPPELIRSFFKKCQKLSIRDVEQRAVPILDCAHVSTSSHPDYLLLRGTLSAETLRVVFNDFIGGDSVHLFTDKLTDVPIFEYQNLPGLLILPSLFAPEIQLLLLSRLLHRDLSNPNHKTNVHLHHHVTYPESPSSDSHGNDVGPDSYFSDYFVDGSFLPKDPEMHREMRVRDFLNKKLRWMTLGGQYDWTKKKYPSGGSPVFPRDIARLANALFAEMKAEAAIVNLYSASDTLSLHRDVSEHSDRGLVSISIGCEAIFVIGNEEGHAVRVRSGDAVFMSKESRFAWHGVPKVLANTCPSWMQAWPADAERGDHGLFEGWRGWMSTKRVNLNIRQMHEAKGS